ncbi:hypothetical protein DDZ14_02670 [Maritimibacter sp. 55A14]|nr:hypothetical protein DDZ14_02670 [Maritimibacter sp. 55A14]
MLVRERTVETTKESDEEQWHHWYFGGLVGIVLVSAIAIITIALFASGEEVWSVSIFFLASVLPIIYIMTESFLVSLRKNETEVDALRAFPKRIFFPAITTCMSSFLVGWFASTHDEKSWYYFLGVSSLYCLVMWASGRQESSTRKSISLFVIILFAAPLLTRFVHGRGEFVAILLALFITMALGVTEVASRLYYITNPRSGYRLANSEDIEFYRSGANWSAYVFIPMVPILALFLPTLPMWLMYLYTAVFLILWIKNEKKDVAKFRYCALAFGFSLPLLIIGGLWLGVKFPSTIYLIGSAEGGGDGSGLSDRVTTILGVLLTIIFVLLQSEYQALISNKNRTALFSDSKNCMLLYFIVASFLSIYSLFVTSILNKILNYQSIIGVKVDEFQIWSLCLIVLVLILYIWDSNASNGDTTTGAGGNDLSPTRAGTNQSPDKGNAIKLARETSRQFERISRTIWKTYKLAKLAKVLVSGLVGLTVAVFAFRFAGGDLGTALLSGASMVFVTAFAFIINDVYDFEKDELGGRVDKVLVTGGIKQSTARHLAAFAAVVGVGLAGIIGSEAMSLQLTTCAALAVYSPFSIRFPIMKGVYSAVVCLAPMLLINTIAGNAIFPTEILLVGFIFFVGRELLVDVNDIEADILAGKQTLAVVCGRRSSTAIGVCVMIGALSIGATFFDGPGLVLILVAAASIAAIGWFSLHRRIDNASALRIPVALWAVAFLV